MKTPKEPVKASSTWYCMACNLNDGMTFEQMMTHAKEAHQLDLKGKKCSKKMVMHLDCADSYHSTWEVECEGLKMTHATTNPRAKNDPMSDYP